MRIGTGGHVPVAALVALLTEPCVECVSVRIELAEILLHLR